MRERAIILAMWWVALSLSAACRHDLLAGRTGGLSREDATREARALSAIGRRLFFDPSLSGSGRLSCASCHSPASAFAPPNALSVQPGGTDLLRPGRRAAPSLMYRQSAPPFMEHRFDSDAQGNDSADSGPSGGLTWDGRVDRGRAQARIPLLSPDEMANRDPASVVAAVARADYAADVRALAGRDIFERPADAFSVALQALEAYEQDPVFYPYTSKYDAYLAGKTDLTAAERRGLALFNDPAKGNCVRCHPSSRGYDGGAPAFTDYGLVALGVPRNREIPANADAAYYDLGLCGPFRTDFTSRADYCGRFKTPSLRNVATRRVFFHNGVLHTLRDVVEFYATRDVTPEKWYSHTPDGSVRVFDDLPLPYQTNVDRLPPFGRRPGDPPALSPSEIDDVVTFLETLTDGFRTR